MPKRLKLKKIRKIKKLPIILTVLIMVFLATILLLSFLNKKVYPFLLNYAGIEAEKIATTVINRSVNKEILSNFNTNELFTTITNDNGEIQTIDFNSINVNKALNMVTGLIQKNLKALESGYLDTLSLSDAEMADYDKNLLARGIIYELPIGLITNNSLLANIGPKVPVKLKLMGAVSSNINTKVASYGINNAMIEVSIHIEVLQKVVLPFISKDILVATDIPVAMKIMQGKIPNYYQNGLDKNSPIFSIPME